MASSLSDAELMFALKEGRVEAFDELVARYQTRLVNFYFHRSWDRHLAEDCAQEVFIRVYSHADTYEPRTKFTTYLFKIAHHYWIDRWRARRETTSLDADPDGGSGPLGDRLDGGVAPPDREAGRRETAERVRRAIDRLPEEQRAVVLLSELQGLKYDEISEVLGVPVGTVKSRMFAAVHRLKDLLAKSWSEVEGA